MKKRRKKTATESPSFIPVSHSKRETRVCFLMNKEEDGIVGNYLQRYKINNKSRWIRETLITFIRQKTEQDYPTLFNEHEMRR